MLLEHCVSDFPSMQIFSMVLRLLGQMPVTRRMVHDIEAAVAREIQSLKVLVFIGVCCI